VALNDDADGNLLCTTNDGDDDVGARLLLLSSAAAVVATTRVPLVGTDAEYIVASVSLYNFSNRLLKSLTKASLAPGTSDPLALPGIPRIGEEETGE
jgi:hypothetical protein